jgi:predicted ABC-type ATPase
VEKTEASPICYVIAGPNGAGKTTFGMWYLPRVARCVEFVNADSIARGLSPLNETAAQMEAGRLFLARIRELRKRMQPLAFETTLSGRSHMRLIREFRDAGYRIELNYLWIPSAEFSAERVASRVANGGHDIPAEAIARRYGKSLRNLVKLYMRLADYVAVWDNSAELPVLVYEMTAEDEVVLDETIWARIEEYGA